LGCIVYYNLLALISDAVENGHLATWPGIFLLPLCGFAVLGLLIALPPLSRRRRP
jgi:hypothetical protein